MDKSSVARILNVNDSEASRCILSRILRHGGFSVDEAVTGQQALDSLDPPPDLIVLDVKLPDISGFEVCRQIKTNPATATIPIVHVSATATSGSDKVQGLDGGADAYLVAPVEPQVLIATVNALLRIRKAESDRDALILKLQGAVRLRDEFLSLASHELKTPLTSLLLHVETVNRRRQAGKPCSDDWLDLKLGQIDKQANRLTTLINQLLETSRISSGRLILDVESVDVTALLQEIVGRFDDELQRAGSTCRLMAPGPIVGRGDRFRLDQIITNLLTNAIKYGNGQPIDVTAAAVGDTVRVTVKDRGIGISSDDQARIFGRFERAISASDYGGFGIGLWIVHEAIAEMGGTVTVTSQLGEGATFEVTLPALVTGG